MKSRPRGAEAEVEEPENDAAGEQCSRVGGVVYAEVLDPVAGGGDGAA